MTAYSSFSCIFSLSRNWETYILPVSFSLCKRLRAGSHLEAAGASKGLMMSHLVSSRLKQGIGRLRCLSTALALISLVGLASVRPGQAQL